MKRNFQSSFSAIFQRHQRQHLNFLHVLTDIYLYIDKLQLSAMTYENYCIVFIYFPIGKPGCIYEL